VATQRTLTHTRSLKEAEKVLEDMSNIRETLAPWCVCVSARARVCVCVHCV
jgi:hypothetical protein